jgi:hypothetical protein
MLGLVGQRRRLRGGQVVAGLRGLAGKLDTSGRISGKTAVGHGIVEDACEHGMGVSHGRCREPHLGNPLLDLGWTNVSDATATPFRFDVDTPHRFQPRRPTGFMVRLASQPFDSQLAHGDLTERRRDVIAGELLDFDHAGERFCGSLRGESDRHAGLRLLSNSRVTRCCSWYNQAITKAHGTRRWLHSLNFLRGWTPTITSGAGSSNASASGTSNTTPSMRVS